MSSNKNFTCIICPRGCSLVVELSDGKALVSGHACERGEEYGRQEAIEPLRSLTTTVRTTSAQKPRLPVRSNKDMPLSRLLDAMKVLDDVIINKQLRCNDLIVENILGLNVDIIASDDFSIGTDGS